VKTLIRKKACKLVLGPSGISKGVSELGNPRLVQAKRSLRRTYLRGKIVPKRKESLGINPLGRMKVI